ncbi:MAG: response regulator [Thermoguttaceae bacterium]|jgi:two-component system chemotaxis response regulator CheY|nr:response regulator [Thermoguttaceae bacterium]
MQKTLLITDDALIIRTMIRDAATAAGWEVVAEAANGQEAIDAYARTRPTAVTLDLVMPEYDGLHGLRGIRELDPEARVVVVSALEQRSVLKEAFRLGAADFILKPFKKDALITTLDQLMAHVTPANA